MSPCALIACLCLQVCYPRASIALGKDNVPAEAIADRSDQTEKVAPERRLWVTARAALDFR